MKRLTVAALVGAILLVLPPQDSASQELSAGVWSGSVTFPDGEEEHWYLQLLDDADGVTGYLLVDAGRGLQMQDIRVGNELEFSLNSPNVPPGFKCNLQARDERLNGSCHDESGATVAVLLLEAQGPPVYDPETRPRARDAGLVVGILPPGLNNAITDVSGVRVGHVTVDVGDDVRTGVTAIIPAPGDLYQRPVPGWIHTVNGYGKLIGGTQVQEFGEIETPILLTCTLCVWSAARELAWLLMDDSSMGEHTINPVVGETNDSWVNNMWLDPIRREHVEDALRVASDGPVLEGSVGAGRGTGAFGWKGGIGTSSRVLPTSLGGYTVGVLVQTNFGGTLTMNGAPVGRELGSFLYKSELAEVASPPNREPTDGGSLMIVVATDAPLESHTLKGLSERAMLGAARTGSFAHNSSGDYVIAFSTATSTRRDRGAAGPVSAPSLPNTQMSPLFAAVVEATEEAIYNAMLKATTVVGRGRVYEPIPLERTLEILERYGSLEQDKRLPGR